MSSSAHNKRGPVDHVKRYQGLPEPMRTVLHAIAPLFEEHPNVLKELRRFRGVDKKVSSSLAVFDAFPARQLLQKRYLEHLLAYNRKGETITVSKIIYKGRHSVVLEGKYGDMPVVIKHYSSGSRNVTFESRIYQKMKDAGAPVIWFDTHWRLWGEPVLVLEKCYPLSTRDDPMEVGVEVIKQLQILHSLSTLHCDVKPGNILVRVGKNNTREFRLCDFGGAATERKSWGWLRSTWTSKYCSQPPHVRGQIAGPKNDLIETLFTIHALEMERNSISSCSTCHPIRSGFTGVLARAMRRIEAIDPRRVTDKDYKDLIAILEA